MFYLLYALLLLAPALLGMAKPINYKVRYENGTIASEVGKRATFHNRELFFFSIHHVQYSYNRSSSPSAIKPGSGADPWVLKYGDSYYLTYTTGGDVRVTKSSNLAQWSDTGTVVYTTSGGEGDVWAPELHEWNGQLYIYVAMDHGSNDQHRMYVLQGTNPSNPLAPFKVSSFDISCRSFNAQHFSHVESWPGHLSGQQLGYRRHTPE
jgi:hypothetical protein